MLTVCPLTLVPTTFWIQLHTLHDGTLCSSPQTSAVQAPELCELCSQDSSFPSPRFILSVIYQELAHMSHHFLKGLRTDHQQTLLHIRWGPLLQSKHTFIAGPNMDIRKPYVCLHHQAACIQRKGAVTHYSSLYLWYLAQGFLEGFHELTGIRLKTQTFVSAHLHT